jgi:hypothetical protein
MFNHHQPLTHSHFSHTSSADAKAAWKKLNGLEIDGRQWKVEWASKKDLDFMSWVWREDVDGGDGAGAYRTASPAPMRDTY